MQLKNGFHLITNNTNFLASIPNHNNNQPFSNVNLVVNEVANNNESSENNNEATVVYSLYENGLSNINDDDDDDNNGLLQEQANNLNFTPNEHGFLELISSDEDDDCSSCSSSSSSSDVDDDDDEEDDEQQSHNVKVLQDTPSTSGVIVSCITCGCFGLKEEFHDSCHCTYDCALITRISEMKKKRKQEQEEEEDDKLQVMKKMKIEQQVEVEEEEEQQQQPGIISTSDSFNWSKIEDECNPFEVNDLMEAIDPEHQCFFCPVRVVEILGHRLLLKFIGYPDKYNFWVYANSQDIFPVNWTTTYSNQLHFHSLPNFSWEAYTSSNPTHRVAPSSCFQHVRSILSQQKSCQVKIGMKLEAVDIRNKNLICVATVSCVMGDRFLIHFDSWDSLYDYWTTLQSAWVHPVGYCKQHGIEITPPHCYETPSEFDWDEYLKKTASVPVPKELFQPQPPLPFQVGQEMEVVDKRSPRLLRPATIASINNHTLTISFPHLNSPSYNYEVNDRSPDLHPVGYSLKTGHPLDSLVPPPENPCPNHSVCRSACSIRGPEFSTHSKSRDCPYSTANLNETNAYTDRVVIFEDKYYDLGGKSPDQNNVYKGNDDDDDDDEDGGGSNDDDDQQQAVVVKIELPSPPPTKNTPPPPPPPITTAKQNTQPIIIKPLLQLPPQQSPATPIIRNSSFPINFSSQAKHPPNIPKRAEILNWSHDRISSLVQSLCSNLPTAQKVADQFKNNLIDGESFLMLTQSDMTDALGIKLGPAIKIYNMIRLIDLNK